MADLEEVDVEQQLKQAEESGDETGSIILSEKSDIDSDDDEEEEEDMQLDEDNKLNEDDMGKESDIEDNDDVDDNDEGVDTYIPQQVEVDDKDGQAPLISGDVPQGMLDQLDEISSDDEEDSDDEEYNENMRKLENDINKDYLYSYHPETKHINYNK